MPDTSRTGHPSGKTRAFIAWLVAAFGIVVADQVTKLYFDAALQYGERVHVLPFFDFTLLYNPGAAFSLLAEGDGWQRWLFTVIALGAAALIVNLLWRDPKQKMFCASMTAILGGAVGNLIDRLQHGHVIDFLLFYWRDWYFPAFNIADIGITCGAALLILDEVLRIRRARAKSAPST